MKLVKRATHWLVALVMLSLLLPGVCGTASQGLSLPDQQRLDRLLTLIDERLAVAEQVAQTKWNSGAPIDDPAREQHLLDAMSASLTGVDPAFARRFFQAQFDAGKIIQRALHAQWRTQARGRFADPPDLARDIRPALDRVTSPLLDALREAAPLLHDEATRQYVQRRKSTLVRDDAGGAAREEALRPLLP